MKYFLLTTSKNDPVPIMKDWYKVIDPRFVNRENAHRIERYTSILVQPNAEMLYPDIMTSPFFMVTKGVAEMMNYYDQSFNYKIVVLFDLENKTNEVYYLPILDAVSCLTEDTEFNLDHSIINRAVIDPKKTQGRAFFKLADVKNNYIIARLDFLESILRRQAMGFDAEEIELADELRKDGT